MKGISYIKDNKAQYSVDGNSPTSVFLFTKNTFTNVNNSEGIIPK